MANRFDAITLLTRGLLIIILVATATVASLADPYADEGTVYMTGTITSIENQQTCDLFNCHIGSTWNAWMTFRAPDWNAPGSHYDIFALMLGCYGGPPCILDWNGSSDFGWTPFYFDQLILEIDDGKVMDARAGADNYFLDWGEDNSWEYVNGFSGTITGYAVPTPDPATLLIVVTGMALIGTRPNVRRSAR